MPASSERLQPWIFPLLVGVLIGLVIGYWPKISGLWSQRRELSGAAKVAEGLGEMGVT
jgi:hypothetical protein